MELTDLLQQLDEIEAQSPHDALALYQPGTSTEQFFQRLCEAYLATSDDQREQAGRSRIKAIIEVEDPVADVGEARVHGPLKP